MKTLTYSFICSGILTFAAAEAQDSENNMDSIQMELEKFRNQIHQLEDKIRKLDEGRKTKDNSRVHDHSEHAHSSTNDQLPLSTTKPEIDSVYMNIALIGIVDAGWSTTPDVEELQRGGHDPKQRGFTLPNLELAIDGGIDAYFKGFASIVFFLDDESDTTVELEEAFLLSSLLSKNLQLKIGQFYAEFGRQNTEHPHLWNFVDQPIVLNRFFGADNLRNPGVRLSWVLPSPVHAELMLGIMNSNGETAFSFRTDESVEIHGGDPIDSDVHGPGDLLYIPRISLTFNLSDQQTVVWGTSAAFGPNNSGEDSQTQIYGTDIFWKWEPVDADEHFPFVTIQAEALYRHYDAGSRMTPAPSPIALSAETLRDWGGYGQVMWGFIPRWVVGARAEYATGDSAQFSSNLRIHRARFSPNLTFYSSDFSSVRLQYNYDHQEQIGDDHSLWIQFEFEIGKHNGHVH